MIFNGMRRSIISTGMHYDFFKSTFNRELTLKIEAAQMCIFVGNITVFFSQTEIAFIQHCLPRGWRLMNPCVTSLTSQHYADMGLNLCSFQQNHRNDRRLAAKVCGYLRKSVDLLCEKLSQGFCWSPKTNPHPGPTGTHTRAEIRARIYRYLAAGCKCGEI